VQRLDSFVNRAWGKSLLDADLHTDPHRQIPAELLESGADTFHYVLRGDIEEHAKSLGWPVARYKSRHAGGFDPATPSLVMIEAPGAMQNPPVTFDRYVNIAIPKDDAPDDLNPTPQKHFPDSSTLGNDTTDSLPHITTMVTVEHANRDSKARLYYQMFRRQGRTYEASSPSNPMQSNCVRCHPSGLRAISPLGYHVRAGEAQLAPDNWMQVKRLNADMTAGQHGGISWGGIANEDGTFHQLLNTADFGPVFGASEPLSQNTRTKEFIVGADGISGCQNKRGTVNVTDIFGRAPGRNNIYTFTSSPPVDWQKVSDAMDCQMCHNNERQGVLNGLTSMDQVDFKILVDQSMPFGAHKNPLDQSNDPATPVVDDLNPNERIALANCLQAEWVSERTKTKEWLQAVPCDAATAKHIKRGTPARLPANTKKKLKKTSKKKHAPVKAEETKTEPAPASERTK
jgi:hypothetical protein